MHIQQFLKHKASLRASADVLSTSGQLLFVQHIVCGRVPWLYQYWPVGLCFLWFFVQELPKAQPAVVLVLKRLRRRGNGLKSHPTDWEKPGIEPATPGLQGIALIHYTTAAFVQHISLLT